MGYYSKVAIVLKNDDFKNLLELAKHHDLEFKNDDFAGFIEEGVFIAPTPKENDFVYLRWNNVKWYYSDTEFIDDFLKTLPDDDYEFLRIGEDYGDWEAHWGANVCTLRYRREIDFDPL